jgi:O-antigen ligase
MNIFLQNDRDGFSFLAKVGWLPATVMIWIAGYFFFPSNKSHYQFFLLVFLSGIVWLLMRGKQNLAWLFKARLLQVGGLYLMFYFLSIFWSVDADIAERFGEVKTVIYLLIFSIIIFYCLDRCPDFLTSLIKLIMVVAGFSLVFNLILFYVVNGNPLTARFHGFGRLWSPLWMAAIYGALTVILMSILTHRFNQFSRTQKIWLMLTIIAYFIAVLATQSRMAIAATIMVSFLVAISGNVSSKFRLFSVLGILVMLMLTLWLSSSVFDRMLERGQSYRLDIWQGALSLLSDKPYTGYGAGSDIQIETAVQMVDGWHHYHSSYVATLVDLGWIGFSLALLLMTFTFVTAWRQRQILAVQISAGVFLYCLLISLTFGEGFISRMNVQWLLFWLPFLVIAYHQATRES